MGAPLPQWCPPHVGQRLIQTPSLLSRPSLPTLAFLSLMDRLLSGPRKDIAGLFDSGPLDTRGQNALCSCLNTTWVPPNRGKPLFYSSLFIPCLYLFYNCEVLKKIESMCCPYFCPHHLSKCKGGNLMMLNS